MYIAQLYLTLTKYLLPCTYGIFVSLIIATNLCMYMFHSVLSNVYVSPMFCTSCVQLANLSKAIRKRRAQIRASSIKRRQIVI